MTSFVYVMEMGNVVNGMIYDLWLLVQAIMNDISDIVNDINDITLLKHYEWYYHIINVINSIMNDKKDHNIVNDSKLSLLLLVL